LFTYFENGILEPECRNKYS